MRQISLPNGESVPALGLGTWRMGEQMNASGDEVAAIRYAFD